MQTRTNHNKTSQPYSPKPRQPNPAPLACETSKATAPNPKNPRPVILPLTSRDKAEGLRLLGALSVFNSMATAVLQQPGPPPQVPWSWILIEGFL